MAKYAEVKEKQKNVDAVRETEEPFNRGIWIGFTYKPRKGGQDEGVSIESSYRLLTCPDASVRQVFTRSRSDEDEEEALQIMF